MLETRYRELLADELANRQRQNESYSLRAFARDLEIEPAALSRVLNGKQGFSFASARLVAEKLFKSTRKKELFLSLVEYSTMKNAKGRAALLKKIKMLGQEDEVVSLSLDTFKIIADWYHLAIADMTFLRGFDPEPRKIAAALGISVLEVKNAIERLLRVGVLQKDADGRLIKVPKALKTPTRVSNHHLRKFHRSMIEKALLSIEGQDQQKRTITGVTVALPTKRLEEVNRLIEDFKRSVLDLALTTEPKDKLYQLNIQFFDLIEQEAK